MTDWREYLYTCYRAEEERHRKTAESYPKGSIMGEFFEIVGDHCQQMARYVSGDEAPEYVPVPRALEDVPDMDEIGEAQ